MTLAIDRHTEKIQLKAPSSNKVMLYALAHPDDESFGSGTAIARYVASGVDVHLICATRGEVGTVDEEHMVGYDTIADLRTAELLCAAEKLGITAVYMLNYRDSGMPGSDDNNHPDALHAAPLEEVTERVTTLIRQVRPQVVVTFDPFGGYGHPDHIKIHQATVAAFDLAADTGFVDGEPPLAPQRLYFTGIPRAMLKLGVKLSRLFGRDPRKFGRNGDINLVELLEYSYPPHYKINTGDYQDIAQAAGECHASQMSAASGMTKPPISWILAWMGRRDNFTQARPSVADNFRGNDLWDGVTVED